MCHPEFFRMTILTSVLTDLTGWVAHLAAHLDPSSAKNECHKVAYHGPAAEASVDTSGDDKHLKKYFIPNVVATWPWPRRLNQHHVEVIAESAAWIASFKAFNPKTQESFDRCRYGKPWHVMLLLMCSHHLSGLLGCLAYPTLTRGESLLRVYQHWTY